MKRQPIRLPWEDPGWLDEVTAWVHARLSDHGRRATGPLELLHQRAWSTFIRVPTTEGIVYFKAPAPVSIYEAALTQYLAALRPDCTVPLLAVDLDRGWLLTANSGVTLRSQTRTPDQVEHWLKLLPLYAELQIEMVDHVPDLLSLGVPDRRLDSLPLLYAQLMQDEENLRVGLDPGLTAAQFTRLQKLSSRFGEQCAQLASYGLPQTLLHEEVTEVNIIQGSGRYYFTDWSEAAVAHPFLSFLVTRRTLIYWAAVAHDAAALQYVRDAYLEPWTRLAARADLLAALEIANRLAAVARALSWQLGTGALAKEHKEPYADSVPGWLQEYLKVEPI